MGGAFPEKAICVVTDGISLEDIAELSRGGYTDSYLCWCERTVCHTHCLRNISSMVRIELIVYASVPPSPLLSRLVEIQE